MVGELRSQKPQGAVKSHKQTNYRLDGLNNAHFPILDGRKSKIKVLADQCLEGLPGLQIVTFCRSSPGGKQREASSLASLYRELSSSLRAPPSPDLITQAPCPRPSYGGLRLQHMNWLERNTTPLGIESRKARKTDANWSGQSK